MVENLDDLDYLASEWALSLAPEWDDLLVSSLEMGAALVGGRWSALFLYDPSSGHLVLARMWGKGMVALQAGWQASQEDPEWRLVKGSASPILFNSRPRWFEAPNAPGSVRSHSCAAAAVMMRGSRAGVVEVVRDADAEGFVSTDLENIRLLANQISLFLRNGTLHRRLNQLASTDGLTGVYNFRYFQDRLAMEVERARRYDRFVSLIMADLNNFKRYNDLLGHQQGDVALRATAATLQRAVRRIDVVSRYGGDEFAIILPETDRQQALSAAGRIAEAVKEQVIHVANPEIEVTSLSVGMGISSYPYPAHGKEELVAQADEALYRAKRSPVRAIRLWEPVPRRATHKGRGAGVTSLKP